MKKLILSTLGIGLTVLLLGGSAHAFALCFVDTQYTPELQLDVEGDILRGQAVLVGAPGFPAPLTGSVQGGSAVFTISYGGETGVRGYIVSVSTLTGTTWGIINATSDYYDLPHAATIVSCGLAAPASTSDSGANN